MSPSPTSVLMLALLIAVKDACTSHAAGCSADPEPSMVDASQRSDSEESMPAADAGSPRFMGSR